MQMQDAQNDYISIANDIENGIGKTFQPNPSDFAMINRISQRMSADRIDRLVQFVQKSGSQTIQAILVPVGC